MNSEQIMALAEIYGACSNTDGLYGETKETYQAYMDLKVAIEALVQERDALNMKVEQMALTANALQAAWDQERKESNKIVQERDSLKLSRDEWKEGWIALDHESGKTVDKLAAENKVLRDALKDMLDGNDKSFRELCRQARAALQGANHD
jgi:chromosome segregation ATPase